MTPGNAGPMDALLILMLLLTANGSPIVARMLLGERGNTPLDLGHRLADGQPVLGPSKTLRGILAAVLATTALAAVFRYGWQIGLIIGSLAMLGDALSSFIKRRLRMPSGSMALGLDHVPEALFPLLACKPLLGLSWNRVFALTASFMIANLLLSRVLFHLGLREHPY
jgi:predicted CDP-diglyceride synthetase/phosphatidate cytidylyltransferase